MLKKIVSSSFLSYREPILAFSLMMTILIALFAMLLFQRKIVFTNELQLLSSIKQQEKSTAGIDEKGRLSQKAAAFIKIVAPDRYDKLRQTGFIQNPGSVDKKFAKLSVAFQVPTIGKPTTPLSPTVSTCGNITQGGTYTLSRDLFLNTADTCLTIHDTSDVTLDCQNHSITTPYDGYSQQPPLFISNVKNFSIANCIVKRTDVPDEYGVYSIDFLINNSQNGILQNNSFANTGLNGATIDSSNIVVSKNTFYGSYNFSGSSYIKVDGNNFTPLTPNNYPQAILARNNNHDTMSNNMIDGTYAGGSTPGEDDAINTYNESDDTITANTMKNFYDCGFESIGFLNNTEISYNTVDNATHCAIGAWYWSSWQNNKVIGNSASRVALMLWLYLSTWDGESVPQPTYYFQNNTFKGNKLLSQNDDDGFGNKPQFSSSFDFVKIVNEPGVNEQISVDNVVVGNNTFFQNDFGLDNPVLLVPPQLATDSGDNICTSGSQVDFPLSCTTQIPTK